jgi:metal-responsive CopG/Arc/MetJ family transcriptional regulator
VATTVHIPEPVLRRVDRRAKALGVSRNRVILDALEASLQPRDEWSPELVRMLAQPLSGAAADAFEESLAIVQARRVSRKGPPTL